jgi:hypothetical protein
MRNGSVSSDGAEARAFSSLPTSVVRPNLGRSVPLRTFPGALSADATGAREPWSALRLDSRGAGLVEYLIVVGLVAIVATAGFEAFGAAALEKATSQAECVASLSCVAVAPAGADGPHLGEVGPTASDTEAGTLDGIPADADYVPIEGDVIVLGADDGAAAVHPSDVDQGGLGDCYLIAALGALALQEPSVLEDAIVDNGDGTYTVTFHEPNPHSVWQLWESDWREVQITVTDEFPVRDGVPVFARFGDGTGDHGELWAMLLEKAYAQWKGGYDEIGDGGSPGAVMTALTGQDSESSGDPMPFDAMAEAFEDGVAIVLSTPKGGTGPLFESGALVGQHAYFVTGVDRDSQTITIRNPWGWHKPEITLTYEQYVESFSTTYTNPADD